MQHTIAIYLQLLAVQLRSQMQYRLSFITDILTSMLQLGFEFGSLALVFGRFESLGGWSLPAVAFLWGLSDMSFGLMDLIFGGFDPKDFGKMVRKGTFDQLLLRPINITAQVLGSSFALRRFGKVFTGLIVFTYALTNLDIAWTPLKIAMLPLILIGLICFFGGLFIIGATITFWTIESIEAINMLTYGGSYLISHPMHIFTTPIRRFFTFIVPAAFLSYYPALYILEKPNVANDIPITVTPLMPFLSPIIGISTLLVALAFWQFGIKHYKSTGS